MSLSAVEQTLGNYVVDHSGRLLEILQDLVRIPSENKPPRGNEFDCQKYIAGALSSLGVEPTLYSFDAVPGLYQHPFFKPGRDYANRPNVAARRNGTGNGRSLLLSGHIDTVPSGTLPWTRDPFGAAIEGNRLYGRGSNDMKAGVATNLFVMECLQKLKLPLAGDVLFESVIDEEFGGVNGTLAGRLNGVRADAVVLSEPSALRICPAQRGGRIAHLTLRASGGILAEHAVAGDVIQQLTFLLTRVQEFADQRRAAVKAHPLYAETPDLVPVSVTKVSTGPWGTGEPIGIPEECRLEIYWQAMPGEKEEDMDRVFVEWLDSLPGVVGSPFVEAPQVEFPFRWLPGSAISKEEALVTELRECAARVMGTAPVVAGIEAPCDMYIFHTVAQTPAVLWGAKGGNTHAADEYVEIDSLIEAAKVLLVFVHQWCGRS
jgi:acetylornithine deacetylase